MSQLMSFAIYICQSRDRVMYTKQDFSFIVDIVHPFLQAYSKVLVFRPLLPVDCLQRFFTLSMQLI